MKPKILRKSQRSEKAAAAEIGGRRTPGSGNISTMKGDVKSSKILLEDKYTDAKSYILTRQVLDKIKKEAFQQNRRPVLRVTIADEVFYVLPRNTFLDVATGELQLEL